MANKTITNIDGTKLIYGAVEYRDELMAFSGADVIAVGTILARRVLSATVTVVAGSNTGNGTVTLAAPTAGNVVPLVGAYVLTCVSAVSHGGVFKLVDPNGMLVATDITMTPGAGGATVVKVAGLQFTITDGSTDFIVGDSFTLTTVADGKIVPYSLTGVGGVQVPIAVTPAEVIATGSGNVAIRPIVAGVVRKDKLIIDADGDDSNVSTTVIDKLRDYGIIATDVDDISVLDNQ